VYFFTHCRFLDHRSDAFGAAARDRHPGKNEKRYLAGALNAASVSLL
jgi:hypothetical protein